MGKNSKSDLKWFWDRLDQHLASQQLKQTKQRQIIAEYFIKLDKHISAEELYDYLRTKGQNTGLATVYRTLNLLKDAGLASQKNFADGKAVYEINKPDSHHDHLICLKCQAVEEFENEEIENLQEEIAKSLGYTLVSHTHELYGICKKCNKEGN